MDYRYYLLQILFIETIKGHLYLAHFIVVSLVLSLFCHCFRTHSIYLSVIYFLVLFVFLS